MLNLATICERYGGGGHARVGAISFPPDHEDEARKAAAEIVPELRASLINGRFPGGGAKSEGYAPLQSARILRAAFLCSACATHRSPRIASNSSSAFTSAIRSVWSIAAAEATDIVVMGIIRPKPAGEG